MPWRVKPHGGERDETTLYMNPEQQEGKAGYDGGMEKTQGVGKAELLTLGPKPEGKGAGARLTAPGLQGGAAVCQRP